MRIIITLFILILTIATAFAEQSYQVKFYRKNGLEPLKYSIYDINKIDIKNVSNKYIVKIHHQDTNTAYYPVVSIDSIKFETDTNQVKYFTPYLFGTKFPYSIAEIDSVIFEEIETIINEDAIVVDTNQLKKILYLDSTLMIVDKSAKFTNGLAAGDIIVGEPSDNTPDGFLRKVIAIKTFGDSIEIETEQAELTDVIQSGVISFSAAFTPQDTAQQKYRQGRDRTMAEEGFTLGFKDIVIYDHDGNDNTKYDQIKIDGSNTFSPKLGFNLVINDSKVKQILIQLSIKNILGLKAHANLESEKTFQKSLNEILGIPALRLPPIVIPVGVCPLCIPVTITSNIDLQVGITLKIGAEVSTKVTLENSAIAGLEYNSGIWNRISQQSSNFDFTPPELSLGGSIKPFLGPQLNINFFNLQDAFNAYVNVFGFGELEVDILKKPLWQLWAGVEANTGIQSKWWSELDYKIPSVIEYRKLLAQAADLISSVTPNEAKVGDTITIKGNGFGNTRGSNNVKFRFGNSLLPVDAIEATNYPVWGDKEIKLLVPNGLDSGKVKLLVNVGGFFSNEADFRVKDSNEIETVTIGTQTWMKKNLDVTRYRNGDSIPQVTDPSQWENLTTGAWCYYNNDPANGAIYGKLYNWYAVNDPRGLAPSGFHVPSDAEWSVLSVYLGGENEAGGKMKVTGIEYWKEPNEGATNSSAFSALPGGSRILDGSFNDIKDFGYWWSSTESFDIMAWYRYIYYNNADFYTFDVGKTHGFSVRCLKD